MLKKSTRRHLFVSIAVETSIKAVRDLGKSSNSNLATSVEEHGDGIVDRERLGKEDTENGITIQRPQR